MKKPIYTILLCSLLLLTFSIALSGYALFFQIKNENPKCGTVTVVPFCGTQTKPYTENAAKGEAIFYSNCAACHHLHKAITGPALHQVDSLTLTKWLLSKNNKIDSTKIASWGMEYHTIFWSNRLNSNDVSCLAAYLNYK
ncbi:cytochrome c [Flavobacterium sp. J27]|uniref:c-type cytochrome n=1 Tax=Flavobacterium sp. J27 TaxID=2060419 RepID=UPI00103098B0|nr:cytochrome c [Flavobacterium sp. J27]